MSTEQRDHAERVEMVGYWHKLNGFDDAMNIAIDSWGREEASAVLVEYIARHDPYGLLD